MAQKKEKDSILIVFMIPLILMVLKMLIYIPVHITGGITNVDYTSHTHIVQIITSNTHFTKCEDCFSYNIITGKYWFENIMFFTIAFVVVAIFYILSNKSRKTETKNLSENVSNGFNEDLFERETIKQDEVQPQEDLETLTFDESNIYEQTQRDIINEAPQEQINLSEQMPVEAATTAQVLQQVPIQNNIKEEIYPMPNEYTFETTDKKEE